MATALQVPDGATQLHMKRKAATLNRLTIPKTRSTTDATTGRGVDHGALLYSPQHKPEIVSRPILDFPRVKRLNTLKYVVHRSHPVVSKSKSLTGVPSTDKARDHQETEMETQEKSLHIGSLSDSSTDVSTASEEDHSQIQQKAQETEDMETTEEEEEEDICKLCSQAISSGSPYVQFADKPYHIDCFKCGKCCGPMGSTLEMFLVQVDGTPLCINCSPTCHTCQNKILQNHVSVLKMDFHEGCLSCFQCKRTFSLVTKIYANQGRPCCSKCILPVFDDNWSPAKLPQPSLAPSYNLLQPSKSGSLGRHEGPKMSTMLLSPSPSTDSGVSETASNDEQLIEEYHSAAASSRPPLHVKGVELNPKLESLSRSITLYSPNDYHTLVRPSFSEPNLRKDHHIVDGLSITSLKAVLFDECGILLFVNYCTNHNIVEYIVFWLDVEHFKHFDGGKEDLKLFAHHIVTKYIGYYADVPVPLSRELQRNIFERVESEVTQDLFNEAQQYIYYQMEKEFLKDFLQSSDGQQYIETLIERDLIRIRRTPYSSTEELNGGAPLRATITNFDKRHSNTKFYVYEVKVERNTQSYYIYRRYSEWYSLHQSLRKAFPLEKFPPLPKKIFLGRSQKRAVAEQRMGELQIFLQGVLSMGNRITNSAILKKFFNQTDTDKEDEIFNRRIQELQARTES